MDCPGSSNIEFDETAASNVSTNTESDTQNNCKPITCRLCLTTISIQFLNIFETIDGDKTIENIVAKHFSFIQPVSDDHYSKNICQVCWHIVRDFHAYYISVQNVHSNLYNTETIFFTTPIKVENSETSDVGDNSYASSPEPDVFGDEIITASPKSHSQSQNQEQSQNQKVELKKLQTSKEKDSFICEMQPKKKKTPPGAKESVDCPDKEINVKLAKPSRLNTLKPLLMPKTFNQQVRTDNIFKRFEKIRPFLADDTNNVFNCNYCNKSFNVRSTASNHTYRHHPLPFVCPEGDARYKTLQEALDHIKNTHTSDHHDSTVCSVCGKTLSTVASLKSHMESVHRPVDQPKVQCKECGAWLVDLKILAIHRSRQHINKTKPMKCDQCSRTLSSAKRLAVHKRRYHELNFNMHKCTICDKEFHFKTRLREHISSVHAGEALYKCSFCPKTFNVRSNYYTHRRRMHPEEHQKIVDKREADRVITNIDTEVTPIKYKCHVCDIEYRFKQRLKEHIAAEHEGAEASFKCEFCTEKFHIRENYYTHRRQQHPAEYRKILDKKVSRKRVQSAN